LKTFVSLYNFNFKSINFSRVNLLLFHKKKWSFPIKVIQRGAMTQGDTSKTQVQEAEPALLYMTHAGAMP